MLFVGIFMVAGLLAIAAYAMTADYTTTKIYGRCRETSNRNEF